MTKYLVAYTIRGGFLVDVPDDDPVVAKEKVRKYVETVRGNMEADITVHYLDELP